MSFEEALQSITRPAGGDLSTKQYMFMTVDSNGRIDITGDGASADGVLQDKPNATDRMGQMAISGVSMVVCGGTVTKGGDVASDAAGKAVDVTTGDYILGVALETGASGDIIPVKLTVGNRAVLA